MKILDKYLTEAEELHDDDIEISCKVVVLNRVNDDPTADWKVLLLRRCTDDGYGMWDLPGGHMRDGESKIEAAYRETKEETNLDIENHKFLKTIHLEIPGRYDKPTMHMYEANSIGVEVELPVTSWGNHSPEHNEYKWVSETEEIETMPMLDQLKEIVIQCLKRRNS